MYLILETLGDRTRKKLKIPHIRKSKRLYRNLVITIGMFGYRIVKEKY